jgi:hypothetical protein
LRPMLKSFLGLRKFGVLTAETLRTQRVRSFQLKTLCVLCLA